MTLCVLSKFSLSLSHHEDAIPGVTKIVFLLGKWRKQKDLPRSPVVKAILILIPLPFEISVDLESLLPLLLDRLTDTQTHQIDTGRCVKLTPSSISDGLKGSANTRQEPLQHDSIVGHTLQRTVI